MTDDGFYCWGLLCIPPAPAGFQPATETPVESRAWGESGHAGGGGGDVCSSSKVWLLRWIRAQAVLLACPSPTLARQTQRALRSWGLRGKLEEALVPTATLGPSPLKHMPTPGPGQTDVCWARMSGKTAR